MINVVGAGWDPNAAIGWAQCVPPVGSPPSQQWCDQGGASGHLGTADENGDWAGALTVKRVIYIPALLRKVDCADPTQMCTVGAADQSDVAGTGIKVALPFKTLPNTIFPSTVRVNEGNSGTTNVTIPVRLSKAQTKTVTVKWKTLVSVGWWAPQADPATDYRAAAGTVTFAPGQTVKNIAIAVYGDTTVETNEIIVVSFYQPVNAKIGGILPLGFAAIVNDDA